MLIRTFNLAFVILYFHEILFHQNMKLMLESGTCRYLLLFQKICISTVIYIFIAFVFLFIGAYVSSSACNTQYCLPIPHHPPWGLLLSWEIVLERENEIEWERGRVSWCSTHLRAVGTWRVGLVRRVAIVQLSTCQNRLPDHPTMCRIIR